MGLGAVVFTEDRYILRGLDGKAILTSFYRMGTGKDPATLDWWGMKADYIIPLIYEIKGDALRIAHPPFDQAAKGAPRPTTFDTSKSNAILIRARRAR